MFMPQTRDSSEQLLLFDTELPRTLRRNMEEQQKSKRLVALSTAQLNQKNVDVPNNVQNDYNVDLGNDRLVDPLNGRCANNVSLSN